PMTIPSHYCFGRLFWAGRKIQPMGGLIPSFSSPISMSGTGYIAQVLSPLKIISFFSSRKENFFALEKAQLKEILKIIDGYQFDLS
ncbi:hypothetical protein Q0M56_13835, partial [Staphylococcus aureus]|nr:hypothetical protein [Staphylococcus aureus]